MAWGTPLTGTVVSNASTDLLNTGITLTPHASTAEGDLMVAFLGVNSAFNHTWAAEAGWTQIFNKLTSPGTNKTSAIYHKYAGASEGSTTFNTDTSTDSPSNFGVIVTYPGGDASTALDVTYSDANHHTSDTNTPTTNDIPHDPITTNTDDAYVVCFMHSNGDAAITATAVATGYTLRASNIAEQDRQFIVQDKIVTSAGTETPGTAAWTSDAGTGDNAYFTIALKGAAANAAPTGNLHGPLIGLFRGVI